MAKGKRPAVKRTVDVWIQVEKPELKQIHDEEGQVPESNGQKPVHKLACHVKNFEAREVLWKTRFNEARQWREVRGQFPKKSKRSSEEELRLYRWLWKNLPGRSTWRQDRWDKLNMAFGKGWEKDCFPHPRVKGAAVVGYMRNEPQWDATLEQVRRFKMIMGRFPKKTGGSLEGKLYEWLRNSSSKSSGLWSLERVKKLDDAFGEGWGRICFPRSIYYL